MSPAHEMVRTMSFTTQAIDRTLRLIQSDAALVHMITFHSHLDRSWTTIAPGVDFCYLRTHGGDGVTVLARMKAGAHAPLHDHPGGEETYLVSGKLRVGAQCLEPGDYLWTPPGVAHDGYAEEDTEFFLVLPAGIRAKGERG
jgi:quercetin dioxygenase-like cupin family protein